MFFDATHLVMAAIGTTIYRMTHGELPPDEMEQLNFTADDGELALEIFHFIKKKINEDQAEDLGRLLS